MRYAQRESPQAAPSSAENSTPGGDQGLAGAAYSVVSRELKLKIVGVADLDPESMRGPTRARVFLPLKLAESLHVMQPTDLSGNFTRLQRPACLFLGKRAREKPQRSAAGRRRNQENGLQHFLDT